MEIKKDDSIYKQCNICHNTEDIYLIRTKSGLQLSMCKQCIKTLHVITTEEEIK